MIYTSNIIVTEQTLVLFSQSVVKFLRWEKLFQEAPVFILMHRSRGGKKL